MRSELKAARDKALALKTADDLNALLDSLNITDEERDIARMVLGRGWSYTRVGIEVGMSERAIRKHMERVYRKIS